MNYRRTSARLARMVSELAEALQTRIIDEDMNGIDEPKPYPAARTKYDDLPLQVAALPDDEPPPVKTAYAIPFPPPLEHRVIDNNGRKWVHSNNHGIFHRLGIDAADAFLGESPDGLPTSMPWTGLLDSYGPVVLDEWTDEDKASFMLYGPPGARWGNPNEECPFYACALGVGHIGMHYDDAGNPIGASEADGSTVDASITPHEASQTPCMCGHPDRHRPGCPRYNRVSGVATEYADPDAAAVLACLYEEERDYEEEAASDKLTEEE